jgi:hypothetical protein
VRSFAALLIARFVDKIARRIVGGLSLLMTPLAAQKLFLKKGLQSIRRYV